MKWTTRKPDKPGWWWYRVNGNPEVIHVDGSVDNGLTIYGCNIKQVLRGCCGEWSDSPIPEPED